MYVYNRALRADWPRARFYFLPYQLFPWFHLACSHSSSCSSSSSSSLVLLKAFQQQRALTFSESCIWPGFCCWPQVSLYDSLFWYADIVVILKCFKVPCHAPTPSPAGCVVCGASPPRALWQFGEMITCVQPNVNPFVYNNYGCYCGFSGSGSPKDQIDQYVSNISTVTMTTTIITTTLPVYIVKMVVYYSTKTTGF